MVVRHVALALVLFAVVLASGCTGCCHKHPTAISSAPPCGCPTPVPAGAVPAAAPVVPAPVPAVPSGYGAAATCPTGMPVR
jgi:hypothetical protein